jgi:hypothetical protein
LYRGCRGNIAQYYTLEASSEVFQDKAFLSTSKSLEVAYDFCGKKLETSFLLFIVFCMGFCVLTIAAGDGQLKNPSEIVPANN